jgi:hypothetical protein
MGTAVHVGREGIHQVFRQARYRNASALERGAGLETGIHSRDLRQTIRDRDRRQALKKVLAQVGRPIDTFARFGLLFKSASYPAFERFGWDKLSQRVLDAPSTITIRQRYLVRNRTPEIFRVADWHYVVACDGKTKCSKISER